MTKQIYIQVGVTALRSPMGDFLPAVPLYIKTSEAVNASGLTKSEENAMHDISDAFAIRHFEINNIGGLVCQSIKK